MTTVLSIPRLDLYSCPNEGVNGCSRVSIPAVPVYANCAISGVERVVREVRSALSRCQREEQVARRSAETAMWSELKESVTAMLLSCDLALATPGVPAPAAEKLRAVHELACQIRDRLTAPDGR